MEMRWIGKRIPISDARGTGGLLASALPRKHKFWLVDVGSVLLLLVITSYNGFTKRT